MFIFGKDLFRLRNGSNLYKDEIINTLRPRQNGHHFADDIFSCIFLNEMFEFRLKLKFVPKDPINNIPALVQIMAWRRPGDKTLSEPMMIDLLTHICVTLPQWVNQWWPCLSPYISVTRPRWVISECAARFHEISSSILNDVIWSTKYH